MRTPGARAPRKIPVSRAGQTAWPTALDSGMARWLALLLLLAACEFRPADDARRGEPGGSALPAADGGALLDALRDEYAPARTLGYGRARDVLFAHEVATDGALTCLYTGWTVTLPPGADESSAAAARGINTEHVWPQSKGARAEPLRSDMHHLFPTREGVNSSRSSLPFGEVPDARTDAWYRLDASQSRTPTADPDGWSERGQGRFEPREAVKGDVARAVFYVVTVYGDRVDMGFFDRQRETLLAWNAADPPDAAERARSAFIAEQQGSENPYVRDPGLADRVFGGGTPTAPPPPATGTPAAGAPDAGPLWISEIHYDNAGDDADEGVEVAGPDGASLDGWTVVLYNGNGGRSYGTVALSGTLAGGALWLPAPGLQNGSPDGVALVAPDGAVASLLSWEGVFTAADGAARGRSSTDIGAEERSDSAPGRSLSRPAPDARWHVGPATPGRR